MADTFTPNFDFILPEVGGSADTWGQKLNLNISDLDTLVRQAMPVGGIIMWSGSATNVPDGWALCNGSNGTPDLRGRFIVGAAGSYSVGDTGGAESVSISVEQMPAHNHSGSTSGSGSHNHGGTTGGNGGHSHSTGSAGNHRHSITGLGGPYDGSNGGINTRVLNTGNAQGGTLGLYRGQANGDGPTTSMYLANNGAHTHSVSSVPNHSHSIGTDGNHTHSVFSQGGGAAHENRPPYYALAFIMKL